MSNITHHSLLRTPSIGAISFVGIASAHADAAAYSTDPSSLTPPASQAGDLVLLWSCVRETTANPAINNTGGQSWSMLTKQTGTSAPLGSNLFWCKFNGTWSANPSVNNNSVAVCRSLFMLVFRPSVQGADWAVHVAETDGDFTLSTTNPTVVGITGQAVTRSSVQVAKWAVEDVPGHSTITGTGWVVPGSAQYRNTAGVDMSTSFAYNIRKEAGSAINTSKTIAATTNTGGHTCIVTFAEII